MTQRQIVFQGPSKSGKVIQIRYPILDDAQRMAAYINVLSDERTFITFQGEHMSVEDEQKFLEKELQAIADENAIFLLVFIGEQLVGISGIDGGVRTSSHVGMFGISIAKAYRGDGIGKILMEVVHEEARKRLSRLRIVYLGLFANNTLAREMYERFGYRVYGRLPEGVFYKGEYIDHLYMYKNLR